MQTEFLINSEQPEADLQAVSNAISVPVYRAGYADSFNAIPRMSDISRNIMERKMMADDVMKDLFDRLRGETWWMEDMPEPNSYNRTIIGLEKPTTITKDFLQHDTEIKSGATIAVVRWGEDFKIPPHGHGYGYIFESILHGGFINDIFKQVGHDTDVVRLKETKVLMAGHMNSSYTKTPDDYNELQNNRNNYIHSLQPIGNTVTLDYVPEHPRDGVANSFTIERYEDKQDRNFEVKWTTTKDAMAMRLGEVALVNSPSLPELGWHYIIVSEHIIPKPHGMRPDTIVLSTKEKFGDKLQTHLGIQLDDTMPTILKFSPAGAAEFLEFHGYKVDDGKLVDL